MAVKIEGDYNGGYDVLLHNIPGVDLGNQVAMPVPGSTGIDSWATKLVASAPFNNTAALERIFDENRGKVAALFMEPVLGNTAAIMPAPGYLRSVRDLCDRHGILLVFDEVKTGFRMALGGAQEYFGVYSDLTMLGKAIANGLPLAAVGGKRELMQLVRAEAVHHCGTYFGNLPCVAAANAALSALRASDYESLMQRGSRLSAGICELLAAAGIPAYYHGVGSMFGITVGPQRPNDYRSWWLHTDREYWCQIARQLEKLGVLTDGFIGLFFLSFAHTDEQIGRTLTMCEDAIRYCQSIRQNHAS